MHQAEPKVEETVRRPRQDKGARLGPDKCIQERMSYKLGADTNF